MTTDRSVPFVPLRVAGRGDARVPVLIRDYASKRFNPYGPDGMADRHATRKADV